MFQQTFDAYQLSIVFGNHAVTGVIKDGGITIARSSDAWTTSVGMKGEVTRSKNSDKTGTVTIILEQSSSSNDYFSEIHDRDNKFGSGVQKLLIKDNTGRTIVDSPEAYILKYADVSYGNELTQRSWTLNCSDLSMFIGGN